MTMPIAHSFLFLVFLIHSSATTGVHAQCNNICSNGNSLGFPTLFDLNCAMQQEVNFINAGIPIRDPPYRYALCPDTDYDNSYDSVSIIPLLNNTIIACGEETETSTAAAAAAAGSCRIMEATAVTTITLIHDLPFVEFHDLTFEGNDNNNNNNDDNVPSVLAMASVDSVASFHRCHWKNRTWVLENANTTGSGVDDTNTPSVVVAVTPIMEVRFIDCTMTDTDTVVENENTTGTVGIRSYGGTVSITNLTVSNYNVSNFLNVGDDATVIIQGGTAIDQSTLKDPASFRDFIFVHDGGTLILNDIVVTRNSFDNFVWMQRDAVVEVNGCSVYNNADGFGAIFRMTGTAASLVIKNSDLSGFGFSLISASGNGPELIVEQSTFEAESSNHAIWSFTDVSISDSCFSGSTIFPPIFVTESEVTFQGAFSDVEVLASNCTGLFVETVGDGCFYPDDEDTATPCNDGTCIPLDADSCSTTRYPPAPTCNLLDACPVVPSIGSCAETLRDLRCIMCGEAQAIVNGATLRPPPYTYNLCPDTVFVITNETEEAIFPILNGTRILCGADGRLGSNCTVDSGELQVEIGQSSRDPNDSLVSPLPLEHVEISGISFTNGIYTRFGFSPSVWARANSNVVAVLKDCTWSEGVGSNILLNMNLNEAQEDVIPSMHVQFDSCSFQDIIAPKEHAGILAVSARVSMENIVVRNYAMGAAFGHFIDSQVSILDVKFTNCTSTDALVTSTARSFVEMKGIEVRDNKYAGFVVASSGSAKMSDILFSGNEGLVDVQAVGSENDDFASSIFLERCTFELSSVVNRVVTEGATMSVISSVFFEIETDAGIMASDAAMLQLTDVCFFGGAYNYPVLVNNSMLSFENVYGENIEASSGCNSISIVNGDDDLCASFDASRCALSPEVPTQTPSEAPTPSPSSPNIEPSPPPPTSSVVSMMKLNSAWISVLMLLTLS